MKIVWIIGGGRFGLKAASSLSRTETEITVVDKSRQICNQLEKMSFRTACMDGVAYLAEHLSGPDYPDWIIPVIPVHVAYEWIKMKLSVQYCLEAIDPPETLIKTLPNPSKGNTGEIYISNADFVCPDNCPEPPDWCTYTGKPRPRILHRFLQSLRYKDCRSVVIRSRQLSPGIGGYTPADLFRALTEINGSHTPILLSTACQCHGVMNAFNLSEKTGDMK
jgi:hypothetical protein